MNPWKLMRMLELLKALSDATRLRLVAILCHGEFTVQELVGILDMGQSRVSRHLKILTEAGALEVKRQGTWAYYRINPQDTLFERLLPILQGCFGTLAGHEGDLGALAAVLEQRRLRSQAFFDSHARQWDDLVRRMLPVADYAGQLVAALPSGALLLDIGTGTGALLPRLCGKASRVIGIDHSSAMLAEASARLKESGCAGVELRLGEMAHLPVPDESADVAVFNMVLHHAPQPDAVLAEAWRVLKKGGTLVIADLSHHELEWVREKLADQWLGFGSEEITQLLTAVGFRLEEQIQIHGGTAEQGVFIAKARKG